MNMKMAFGAKAIWSGSSATCAEHNALTVDWTNLCMCAGLLFGNRKWGCDFDCPIHLTVVVDSDESRLAQVVGVHVLAQDLDKPLLTGRGHQEGDALVDERIL